MKNVIILILIAVLMAQPLSRKAVLEKELAGYKERYAQIVQQIESLSQDKYRLDGVMRYIMNEIAIIEQSEKDSLSALEPDSTIKE